MTTWQQQLQNAVTDRSELYRLLSLSDTPLSERTEFPLRVPRSFIARMECANPRDPLLLQVLVQTEEFNTRLGFIKDPLKEMQSTPVPGLLHKYYGRVLLVLTGSCAVNCRYCFRRHFPYNANTAIRHWPDILAYLTRDLSIEEVILSGGDPLLLDDDKLTLLIHDLEKIPHVKTLRIHTRLPIVIPDRITPALVRVLSEIRLRSVMVLHSNHANEIGADVAEAMLELKKYACLLNQSVLLKDVNDSVDTLVQLSKRLFEVGVLPYYVHQLDPVAGAHHFYVAPEVGLKLMKGVREKLPGYLVPQYVQEIPGELSKSVII